MSAKIGAILEVKKNVCRRFNGESVDIALCRWHNGLFDDNQYDGRVICEILADGSLKKFRYAYSKDYVLKLWKNFRVNGGGIR